jgi:peptide chain release factor 1
VIDRLQQMEQRYEDLSAQLSLPEVVNDREKYHQAGKALRDLETPVMKFRELKQVSQGLAEARAMLAESDPELRAMAEEEIAALAPRETALEEDQSAAFAHRPQRRKERNPGNPRRHRRR